MEKKPRKSKPEDSSPSKKQTPTKNNVDSSNKKKAPIKQENTPKQKKPVYKNKKKIGEKTWAKKVSKTRTLTLFSLFCIFYTKPEPPS